MATPAVPRPAPVIRSEVPVRMSEVVTLIDEHGWSWGRRERDTHLHDGQGHVYQLRHRSGQYYLEPLEDHRRAAAGDHD
jgi:hypothetical protein